MADVFLGAVYGFCCVVGYVTDLAAPHLPLKPGLDLSQLRLGSWHLVKSTRKRLVEG